MPYIWKLWIMSRLKKSYKWSHLESTQAKANFRRFVGFWLSLGAEDEWWRKLNFLKVSDRWFSDLCQNISANLFHERWKQAESHAKKMDLMILISQENYAVDLWMFWNTGILFLPIHSSASTHTRWKWSESELFLCGKNKTKQNRKCWKPEWSGINRRPRTKF